MLPESQDPVSQLGMLLAPAGIPDAELIATAGIHPPPFGWGDEASLMGASSRVVVGRVPMSASSFRPVNDQMTARA